MTPAIFRGLKRSNSNGCRGVKDVSKMCPRCTRYL
nr:MAG TPA: integrase [Caudoviricetes sp.]